jgi:hypothetical protein
MSNGSSPCYRNGLGQSLLKMGESGSSAGRRASMGGRTGLFPMFACLLQTEERKRPGPSAMLER